MVFLFINLLLPNTIGKFRCICHEDNESQSSGAFSTSNPNFSSGLTSGNIVGGLTHQFNASNSNSIYVDNGTVRPKSLSVLVLLRL